MTASVVSGKIVHIMDNLKALKSYSRCVSFCTAASYDLLGLLSHFKKRGYFTRLSRDVLHVSSAKRGGDVFFFNHGCFVAWGFKKSFEDRLIQAVKEYAITSASSDRIGSFLFSFRRRNKHRYT